jgi:hypothetical protein
VAVVIPRKLAADHDFTDGMAVAIIDELSRHGAGARRIFFTDRSYTLLETLCSAVTYGDAAATMPELLDHEEARGTSALIVAADFPSHRQVEMAAMLSRLDAESRTRAPGDRLTLVSIVTRDQLPSFAGGATSEASLVSVWWWNRVSRWDVGAHLADVGRRLADSHRVLDDVRTETIIEVARWDLDMADALNTRWSGEPSDLARTLCQLRSDRLAPRPQPPNRACGTIPADEVLESWDRCEIDGWHDEHAASALHDATSPERLLRLAWAAQARVLLPWIEQRRRAVEDRVVARLGEERFARALEQLFDPPLTTLAAIEIGQLKYLVEARIGNTDSTLRTVVRRMSGARNALAHLRPLRLAELIELVAACESLE